MDYGAFDRTLNPTPSLSKRFIIGDGVSEEENITLEQHKVLILPTDGTWTQLGLLGSWQAYSIGGMRSGVYYRVNKAGQLEIDISVSYPAVAVDSNLAQLPIGSRPAFSKVIQSQFQKDIVGHGPCWINIDTTGLISLNELDDSYDPAFYFAHSIVIPLT